jgi:glutathione S-transferase
MLKIWGRNNSINVQKVMWTVGELGLAHERIDAGGAFGGLDTDDYGAKNPNRLVPVLEESDGRVLWESHAIVRYLASVHGRGGLWPEDDFDRASVDRWMDWMVTTLHPDLTPVFWGLFRNAPAYATPEARAPHVEKLGHSFAILDRHLADRAFVGGDTFTMGDIPVGAATYRYYALAIDHADLPHLRRWYESLTSRPAYATHVMIPLT